MTFQEEGQIQIHTENIFPIIKKAVYSDHEIFLRELVSNGIDAINKRRMVAFSGDCIEGDIGEINIKINREDKTLTFSDNGIGMTADEIKKYINQVAFSSAEEFLEKYKKGDDSFIGHFGLGFYSSFMVAKNVEIITKSAINDSESVRWQCDGSPKFFLENYEKEVIGTDIILHLMDEEIEYLEPSRIKTLIKKYCDFMSISVSLEGEKINRMVSPWRKNPTEMKDDDYVEFYKYLYPFQGDPLLWVHLKTDYPYNLQGILFFPKITGRADWENGEIKLFCNQVFVSDSIKEVVPRYLLPLRGVIDSPDIPLNVSRSALQSDRKVKSIGNFISKKIADRLKALYKENKKLYLEIWDSLSPFLKIGAMDDDKFSEQINDILLFKSTIKDDLDDVFNSNGIAFTTLEGYLNRTKDNNKKRILYCTDENAQQSALNLWTSSGNEVLMLDGVIDSQFIPWLESKNSELMFQRVDSELDKDLKEEITEIVDKDGENETDKLRSLFKNSINNKEITIQIDSLKGDNAPPSMILLPEQMRRINDIGALMEQKIPGLPDNHVLLINKKHPLVKGILKISETKKIIIDETAEKTHDSLSNEIAKHLYDMAKNSVGGLNASELANFNIKNAQIMAKLIDL